MAGLRKDFELDYCQNKPGCLALVDADEDVPEEHCRACLLEYLQKPEENCQMTLTANNQGDKQKEETL